MTVEEAVKSTTFPIFGADSYANSTERIGNRTANGRVYLNVRKFDSIRDLPKTPPKYLISVEDDLVREMIIAELRHQKETPNRPNVPLFFLRDERFKIFEIEGGQLKATDKVGLQNIKVVGANE